MSAPFTPPANATWQSLLTELTLAYSERRQAIAQSAYTPTAGKDVQARSYWTTLQAWLETKRASYINHISGPLNPAGTAFLYFTLATWRAAADLNAAGFRRATVWDGITAPTWSYGQMQANDIIGPWIFEDLQKGFGALRWSKRITNSATVNGARGGGDGHYSGSCEAQKQHVVNTYSDWGSEALGYSNWAKGIAFPQLSYHHYLSIRKKYTPKISGIPAIPRIADLYLRLYNPDPYNPYGSPTYNFFNNGDGLPYGQTFSIIESFAETNEITMNSSSFIGDGYSSNPILFVSCPLTNGVYSWGCVSEDGWLLKWNFTNQNP